MKLTLALCLATTLCLAGTSSDIKTEFLTRTTLLSGIGTTEVKSAVGYALDKRAETQEMRMVGGIGGVFAGKPKTAVTVTRLDREVIWEINHTGKTYAESPLVSPADQESSGGRRTEVTAQGSGRPPYRVKKTELKVTKTGQKKDINSFPCAEYVLTLEVVLEDTASKGTISQLMTMDMWNTPMNDKLKAARDAELEFNRRLAEKRGITAPTKDMDRLGVGMFTTMYGIDPAEAATQLLKVDQEMSKIEGYPIVTDLKWQVKGDSSQVRKPEPEPEPSGGLGGMLASKIAQKVTPQKSEPDVVFSSYYELKSVSLGQIADAEFEVPTGYKKARK